MIHKFLYVVSDQLVLKEFSDLSEVELLSKMREFAPVLIESESCPKSFGFPDLIVDFKELHPLAEIRIQYRNGSSEITTIESFLLGKNNAVISKAEKEEIHRKGNFSITLRCPTDKELEASDFNIIWRAIKKWDIGIPELYEGHTGAMGNHVVAILDELKANNFKIVKKTAMESYNEIKQKRKVRQMMFDLGDK